jgi:hypothetical protein
MADRAPRMVTENGDILGLIFLTLAPRLRIVTKIHMASTAT